MCPTDDTKLPDNIWTELNNMAYNFAAHAVKSKYPDVLKLVISKDRLYFTINDETEEHELKCECVTAHNDRSFTLEFRGFLNA